MWTDNDLQNTESFDITVLIEGARVATRLPRVVDGPVIQPERGVLT